MGDRVKVKLVSTGLSAKGTPTGYYKTVDKSNKPGKSGEKREKLQKMCFDPRAINKKTGKPGMHVIFKEDKIKS